MRVGIVGSGRIGGNAGKLFARAGHEVMFSFSRDPAKLEALAAEAAVGSKEFLAQAVEPVDLGPAGGQHDHLLGGVVVGLLPGGPPVLEERQGGGRLGVGGHHPVMGLVGGHRLLDQPAPHQLQGLAFPGLLLAAVLSQL